MTQICRSVLISGDLRHNHTRVYPRKIASITSCDAPRGRAGANEDGIEVALSETAEPDARVQNLYRSEVGCPHPPSPVAPATLP